MDNNFEPTIIGFTCNWCSYRAADLAGTARMKYAPNVRLIRMMCSGRLDPTFVLRALSNGADGVMIEAAARAGAKGIVSAGTGAGRPTPAEEAALEKCVREHGVVVCLSSRIASGRVGRSAQSQDRGFVARVASTVLGGVGRLHRGCVGHGVNLAECLLDRWRALYCCGAASPSRCVGRA